MELEIVCRDFPATEAIKYHVENKLLRLLAWNQRKLEHVRVTMGDTNGPRGGVDKYCCITVQLRSGRAIRVEHLAGDLYEAVAHCAARTERAVLDEIAKRRGMRRRRSLGMMWG